VERTARELRPFFVAVMKMWLTLNVKSMRVFR
jgi:hypothetical protein